MEFKTSFDWYAKTVIGFVTILFLGIIAFYVVKLVQAPNALPLMIPFLFSSVLLILIYVICYLYRPLKYVIEGGKLIIKRPLKDKFINLSDIKDVYAIKKDSMGWVMKTFGNGGLFGFYGEFRSDRYGHMTWYATRKSNYVMLESSEGRIVLTPDNLEMIGEIKKLIRP
jgi:hypothetical protein